MSEKQSKDIFPNFIFRNTEFYLANSLRSLAFKQVIFVTYLPRLWNTFYLQIILFSVKMLFHLFKRNSILMSYNLIF